MPLPWQVDEFSNVRPKGIDLRLSNGVLVSIEAEEGRIRVKTALSSVEVVGNGVDIHYKEVDADGEVQDGDLRGMWTRIPGKQAGN